MMKNIISCSTHCYNKFSFERALEGIAGVGIEYVEIGAIPGHCEHVRPELLNKEEMLEVKRKIEQYGLKPSSISGHCDLTTQKGVELFKKRIDFAYNIGVNIINTAEGHVKSDEEEESFFCNIREISKYLEERCITACLETHGGILGTSKDLRRTLERIGSERVKVNYDPANLIYFVGKRPEDDIIEIVEHIGHFHIKDKLEGQGVWNFPAVGDGYIDFDLIFDVLYKNNYEGPLSFEIEFVEKGPDTPEEVDQALAKSCEHIKRIMESKK